MALGCEPEVVHGACVTVGGEGPLVAGAAAFRVDIYGATASCVGGVVAPGAGTPSLSRIYTRGQPIELDVAPVSARNASNAERRRFTSALVSHASAAPQRRDKRLCFREHRSAAAGRSWAKPPRYPPQSASVLLQ
jgi:hypothetical protein